MVFRLGSRKQGLILGLSFADQLALFPCNLAQLYIPNGVIRIYSGRHTGHGEEGMDAADADFVRW